MPLLGITLASMFCFTGHMDLSQVLTYARSAA